MIKAVEPRILQQDVQAPDKGPRRVQLWISGIHEGNGTEGDPRPSFLTLTRPQEGNNGTRAICSQSETADEKSKAPAFKHRRLGHPNLKIVTMKACPPALNKMFHVEHSFHVKQFVNSSNCGNPFECLCACLKAADRNYPTSEKSRRTCHPEKFKPKALPPVQSRRHV